MPSKNRIHVDAGEPHAERDRHADHDRREEDDADDGKHHARVSGARDAPRATS